MFHRFKKIKKVKKICNYLPFNRNSPVLYLTLLIAGYDGEFVLSILATDFLGYPDHFRQESSKSKRNQSEK